MYIFVVLMFYIFVICFFVDELLEIVMKRIEEVIRNKDRLIDVINVCKIMSKWFCVKGKVFEVY